MGAKVGSEKSQSEEKNFDAVFKIELTAFHPFIEGDGGGKWQCNAMQHTPLLNFKTPQSFLVEILEFILVLEILTGSIWLTFYRDCPHPYLKPSPSFEHAFIF